MQGDISVVPYRKNINLRGTISIAIQLRSDTLKSVEREDTQESGCGTADIETLSSVSGDEQRADCIEGSSDDADMPHSRKSERKKSMVRRAVKSLKKKQCVLCSLHHLMMKGRFKRKYREHGATLYDAVDASDDDDSSESIHNGVTSVGDDTVDDRHIGPHPSSTATSPRKVDAKQSTAMGYETATAAVVTKAVRVVSAASPMRQQCWTCSNYYKLAVTAVVAVACITYFRVLDLLSI